MIKPTPTITAHKFGLIYPLLIHPNTSITFFEYGNRKKEWCLMCVCMAVPVRDSMRPCERRKEQHIYASVHELKYTSTNDAVSQSRSTHAADCLNVCSFTGTGKQNTHRACTRSIGRNTRWKRFGLARTHAHTYTQSVCTIFLRLVVENVAF